MVLTPPIAIKLLKGQVSDTLEINVAAYIKINTIKVCALNIFGKNSQYFWQNILGKWELEIVIFKPPFLPLILRILL